MACDGDAGGLLFAILLMEVLEECNAEFGTLVLDASGEQDEVGNELGKAVADETGRNGCGKETDGVIRLELLFVLLVLVEFELAEVILFDGLRLMKELFVSCFVSAFHSGFTKEKSRNSS